MKTITAALLALALCSPVNAATAAHAILCTGTVKDDDKAPAPIRLTILLNDTTGTVAYYDRTAGTWRAACNCDIDYGAKVISWSVPVEAPPFSALSRLVDNMNSLNLKMVIDREAGTFGGGQIVPIDDQGNLVVEIVNTTCKPTAMPKLPAARF